MCYTNTRDGSYLFFKGHAPPWGAPPPMGKAKIAEFFQVQHAVRVEATVSVRSTPNFQR